MSTTPTDLPDFDAPALRALLVAHFSVSELRDLCHDMQIDYEQLDEGHKGDKARGLVAFCERHERLPELAAHLRRLRPHAFGAPPQTAGLVLADPERHYLEALVRQYESVSLARFIEVKRGTGDDAVPPPTLDAIFTALTTEEWRTVPPGERRRPARSLRRLARFFRERRSPQHAPPERVRLLECRAKQTDRAARRIGGSAADMLNHTDGWFPDPPADDVPDDEQVLFRLRRPELAAETFAPRAGAPPPRVLLLGDPGSGKSTALRYVAIHLARALLAARPPALIGWDDARIPLLLPLGTLGERRAHADAADGPRALLDALAALLDRAVPGLGESLRGLLPRAVLLLDGLDELSAEDLAGPGSAPRARAAAAVAELAARLPETPVVVTCRERPFRDRSARRGSGVWQQPFEDRRWQARVVQPFAFGQVRAFVRAWYGHTLPNDPLRAAERAADLLGQLEAQDDRANPLGQAIAATRESSDDTPPPASPLLLTMLTILHYNAEGRPLPPERDLLYERLVELLLHTWEPSRSRPDYTRKAFAEALHAACGRPLTADLLRAPVHRAAYEAHATARRGGDGRGVLRRRDLRGLLVEYFVEDLELDDAAAGAVTERFLTVLHMDAGLLTRLGDDAYLLPHLTFQEYLAACHLASLEADEMADAAYAHWRGADRDRWREVVALLMGRIAQREKGPNHGVQWLRLLTAAEDDDGPKPAAQRQRDALLAAACLGALTERGALRGRHRRQCEGEVRAALHSIIPLDRALTSADLHLPPAERARAAVFLAQLGTDDAPADTRPGVCALPRGHDDAGYWADLIAAGEYPIAGGQATVRLGAFRVARYPVTIWQFRQFWKDPDGYESEEHWPKQGWAWKKQPQETKAPYLWDNPDWTADNQPVVGVSWYEAMAFCSWLRARGRVEGWLPEGWTIVLPTEAQWEVAAQWDAQRGEPRPWSPPDGELWQNCEEAGIGRTSPVGLFPHGASPCGALDMAGNAWEWCASAYAGYPGQSATPGDDFAPNAFGPALRGGSYSLQNARSFWGARYWLYPGNLIGLGSFRVCVCSAPPSKASGC